MHSCMRSCAWAFCCLCWLAGLFCVCSSSVLKTVTGTFSLLQTNLSCVCLTQKEEHSYLCLPHIYYVPVHVSVAINIFFLRQGCLHLLSLSTQHGGRGMLFNIVGWELEESLHLLYLFLPLLLYSPSRIPLLLYVHVCPFPAMPVCLLLAFLCYCVYIYISILERGAGPAVTGVRHYHLYLSCFLVEKRRGSFFRGQA